MIWNYFKTAWRTLLKNKVSTFINVLGLTVGICACMLVTTVVLDEISYDSHWKHADNLYRIVSVHPDQADGSHKSGAAYVGLAPELQRNFPEVIDYSELYISPIQLKINKQDSEPFNSVMLYTDTSVQNLLDINLLQQGDLAPSSETSKIIISKSFKENYFPNTDPVGKILYDVPRYEAAANEYLIAGVMDDMPANTHLRADLVLIQNRSIQELNKDDWGRYVRHYLLLREGTDYRAFAEKVNTWYKNNTSRKHVTQFEFQPIQDVYLKSDFPAYQIIKGNIQHIYIFSGVAILLLLIACINYVNLSTARALSRRKETGVRKVLGASRAYIITQFLIESLLTFGIATCIAFVLYQLSISPLEAFIGHPLAVTLNAGWQYIAGGGLSILFICLLTGLYPAWLISGFKGSGTLNKLLQTTNRNHNWLRKSLVVAQFSISIVIVVAMLIVQQQVNFMKNKDVGFNADGLISINHVSFENNLDALKTEIKRDPSVISLSISSWLPSDGAGYMVKTIDNPLNPGEKQELWYIAGDPNLAETLGLQLTDGRFLSSAISSDALEATDLEAEVNATRPAIMTRGTFDALQINSLNQPFEEAKILPVGIVEDFNSESLHKTLMPTVIVAYKNPPYGALLIRVKPGTEHQVMKSVASTWREMYPEKFLDMSMVKETLESQYKAEEKLRTLFTAFSLLTMLLAALGVFGLVVHAVSLRFREIGVRKVLGASVSGIATMLSKDFIKPVFLAILIASPIAWWAMNKWLEDFAYRIEIQWWMFALAGLGAILIALITVSSQAIKAAIANPVDSLRDE
ncbi:ABC transporter permease [Albibacterium profundi]|uniref:FtsX-like permease family protein n=1 Tax=Albibacterium profundi TaxID=3134906 RepID=A0ABV5CA94_9SPHI